MIGILVFVVSAGLLGLFLNQAFGALSATADQIDDLRALEATRGAISAMEKQLGATIRDNSYWEDAYNELMTPERNSWASTTWGVVTEDYPLYDAMLLVDPARKNIVAYHDGLTLSDPFPFFDKSLAPLVKAARLPEARKTIPVAFIGSNHGLMLIGAAAVQPLKDTGGIDPEKLDVLVLAKEITPSVVEEISTNFSIKDLKLEQSPEPGRLSAPLHGIDGKTLGYFTWPPQKPGSRSFERVKPIVTIVAVMLILFLAGIAWAGRIVIANLRRQEAAARHDALHDPLTDLVNRAGFGRDLAAALKSGHGPLYLHLFDLDGFKHVNDTFGHPLGDMLLLAVAGRLRDVFPDAISIARLGGDEYAILAREHAGDRIVRLFKAPFHLSGRIIEIAGSVGVADIATAGASSVELVRQADVALYRAKARGKNRSVDFEQAFDTEDLDEKLIEADLRRAIAECRIEVDYQPLIAATTYQVTGVEALARWRHPERGFINPEIFVRIAEKSALIDDLGRLVLCQALLDLADWHEMEVSVNVSPVQLRNPGFAEELAFLLDDIGFAPGRLTLEVTEGVFISQPELARRTILQLKAMGIRVALDDFGCGYASLGALREFGFDKMKIDRSLTCAVDEQGAALLRATVALAAALSLPVTAEGIETEEQAMIMRLNGCDQLQGFLFGRPCRLEQLEEAMQRAPSQVA